MRVIRRGVVARLFQTRGAARVLVLIRFLRYSYIESDLLEVLEAGNFLNGFWVQDLQVLDDFSRVLLEIRLVGDWVVL